MKAKYLKPAFLEKSDDVKLTFTVTADEAAQVFSLKRGESYEIAPVSQEVAGDSQSPTEKLETAQRLISEAVAEMGCDTVEPKLPLIVYKRCGTCAEWTETRTMKDEPSVGICAVMETETRDNDFGLKEHPCGEWREDK